jgi:membrane protein
MMAPAPPRVHLVRGSAWGRFWGLLWRALVAFADDNCFGMAKGAAYSSLLAFFPLLASLAAILAQVKADSVSRVISRFLFEVVPPGSEDLVRYVFIVKGQRPAALLVLASLLAVLGASGVMNSLMQGFQAAYKIPRGRPFFKQQGVAILLVFLVTVPAVGASLLIIFGTRTEQTIMTMLGVLPDGENLRWSVVVLSRTLRYAVAFATTVFVNGLLYYFGPNRRLKFSSVWPGAVLATTLSLLVTSGFALYVRHIANYNLLYGSVGAFIALLVWMFLLAAIAIVGCEFNAERERLLI